MKILKRDKGEKSPHQTNGNANAAGKPKTKTLKQREEEYAKARLRILGSTGAEEEAAETNNATTQDCTEAGSRPPVTILADRSEANTVRTPMGPDGTKGFHKR